MRKSTKLMAGLGVVAGLGVALAPLATFAANTSLGTDTLIVTVEKSCVMTSGVADNPSTTGVDESAYTSFNNYYEGTLPAGGSVVLTAADRTDGQGGDASDTTNATALHITCNDAYDNDAAPTASTTGHGWSIKGVGTVLTGDDTHATIPVDDPSDGATSGWGVRLSESDTNGNTTIVSGYEAAAHKALPEGTPGVIAFGSKAGADAAVTIVSYKVSASAEQAADTYRGTATYTFVAPQA